MSTKTLRLRLKVWANPVTHEEYLVPIAMIDPRTELVVATAMRDSGQNIELRLTIQEWNDLPYYYFTKDSDPAPKPPGRTTLLTIP